MKTLNKLMNFTAVLAVMMGCLDTAAGQGNALVVSPASGLTFNTQQGFSPAPQPVTVSTTGAAVNFTITTVGGTNCTLNYQSTGILVASQAAPVIVQVSPQTASLPTGSFNCSVKFSASGLADLSLPVIINVGNSGGTSGQLTASPVTLPLTATTGGAAATGQITLSNANPSVPVNFNATVSSTPAGWLLINPNVGTTPPNNSIQVQANPAGLGAGSYVGQVSITPQGSSSPIVVTVNFTVSGSPTVQVTQNGAAVSSVSFAYQTGTSLPPLQTISLSNTSANSLTCTVSPNGGASFLVINPQGTLNVNGTGGAATNIILSIASSAATLAPGTYSASVVISCSGASNPSINIPVSFLVSQTPLLTFTGNLPSAFNFTIGGGVPTLQTAQVATSSTALAFTATSNQTWLLVSPATGTASSASPATLVVQVSPAGLAAGTYTGTVTVASPASGNGQITFPVTLNVSTSVMLNAIPSSLTYTYQVNQAVPLAQTVTVTSTGATLNYTVTPSVQNCPGFLTVSQTSGTATLGTSSQFLVSVNTAGIVVSTVCTGNIAIAAPGAQNSVNIPVTLEVSTTPIIQLSQTSISFVGQLGGARLSTQLSITSSDQITGLQYSIFNTVPWLSVTGVNAGSTPNNVTITVDPSAPGLVVGDNKTVLTIQSPSLPVPISLPVTLTLTSAATVTASPTALTFTQATGGPVPANQSVNLTLAGATGTNSFSAVAATSFGNWLTVTSSGTTFPGTLTVSVNGATLSPGSYNGTITVTAPGASNNPLTINVTLTVSQPQTLSVTPSTLTFAALFAAASNPANQTVQLSSTGGSVAFTATASATDCNSFITVSPVQGSTPASGSLTMTIGVNVAGLPVGTCHGTVTISANGITSQTVAVAFTITAPPAPQLTSIVNGASFIPGAVAPGEIVTLFGNNIGPITLTTYILNPNNTFATKVADTEILFDGVPAPILFVRADQVAVVVPWGVGGRFQSNIQIRRSTGLSNTLQQRVTDTAPGIFTSPSGGTGSGAILNQNGTVNAPGLGAAKGSVIALYITGAGAISPAGSDGALGSSNPSALQIVNADTTVTIGGLPATVQYKGAAPGYIQGLYQINVTVPQSVASGNQPVQVTIGGVASQSGVTVTVQ